VLNIKDLIEINSWSKVNKKKKKYICISTEKASMEEEGVDALDAFMMSIKSGGMDTRTRMELKRRGVELRQQRLQLERLVALAKPCSLPRLDNKLVTSHSVVDFHVATHWVMSTSAKSKG